MGSSEVTKLRARSIPLNIAPTETKQMKNRETTISDILAQPPGKTGKVKIN